MANIVIIGHGQDKFTPVLTVMAQDIIKTLVEKHKGDIILSGNSPCGGVDLWAMQEGLKHGRYDDACHYAPNHSHWDCGKPDCFGFKARNIKLAEMADFMYIIVVDQLPPNYRGRVYPRCYHCHKTRPHHIKSGACWTGWKAVAIGKKVVKWLILPNGWADGEGNA